MSSTLSFRRGTPDGTIEYLTHSTTVADVFAPRSPISYARLHTGFGTSRLITSIRMVASALLASLARRRCGVGHRWSSTAATRGLVSAQVDAGSALVALRWADGLMREFHPLWLLDNCATQRRQGSRQKIRSAAELPRTPRVATATADTDVLRIQWEHDHDPSTFCSEWLRGHGSSSLADAPAATPPAPPVEEGATVWPSSAAHPTLAVTRFAFADLLSGGEAARWAWLSAIADHGATLIEGVPQTVPAARREVEGQVGGEGKAVDGVSFVASLLGPLQPNIYGNLFDVVSVGGGAAQAINVAYTSEGIGPHMDLCYYESPPGLQLLHCLRFDADVSGGESFLIDSFAVAEAIRAAAPEAFEALSSLPATFVKDHSKRDQPVLLSYQRPHFAIEPHTRRLTGVFWSPPFEGPLRGLSPDQTTRYYSAYRLLDHAIANAPR
jgi:hypothetical protein